MVTVDFKSLLRLNQLGGRGCTTLVHTPSDPSSQFVFKAIDFRTFLYKYESGHIQEEVKIYYHSMELVSNMPRHPNIMAPAQTLVPICKSGDDTPFVCGSLYPFLPNGSLAGHIEKNNESGERLPCRSRLNSVIRWPKRLRIPTSLRIPTIWTLSLGISCSTQISVLCLLIGSKVMPPLPRRP